MRITGACHCSNISYEAEVNPEAVVICHCTDCQTLSGGTYRTLIKSVPDGLSFKTGEPKEYIKIAENGNRRAQGFCPDCGTSLYATSEDKNNRVYGIRLGTCHQRDLFTPKLQIWCRSAQPWAQDITKISRFDTVPN